MGRSVAVFGSSEPSPGDRLYEVARRTGRLLAESGFVVVTGGYGGVMEGASRGAHEAGGHTVGVTCAVFSSRKPNPFLSEVHETGDLFARTRRLVELSDGFIVLPGKSGTLAEVSFLWALMRAGSLEHRPVVLLEDLWRSVVDVLVRTELLEGERVSSTEIARGPEEAVSLVRGFLAGPRED